MSSTRPLLFASQTDLPFKALPPTPFLTPRPLQTHSSDYNRAPLRAVARLTFCGRNTGTDRTDDSFTCIHTCHCALHWAGKSWEQGPRFLPAVEQPAVATLDHQFIPWTDAGGRAELELVKPAVTIPGAAEGLPPSSEPSFTALRSLLLLLELGPRR